MDMFTALKPSHPGPAESAWPGAALADQAQIGLYVVQGGLICYANPAFTDMVGWPLSALLGQAHTLVVAAPYRAHAEAAVGRRLQGKAGRSGEVRFLRRDGSSFDVRVLGKRIQHAGAPAVLVTLLDITELKQALRSAEWNAGMLAQSEALCGTGSFELQWPGGQLRMSQGLRALLGQPDSAPLEGHIDALAGVPPEEQAYVAGIWAHAVPGEPFEFQHRLQCADGRRLVVLHRGLLKPDTPLRIITLLRSEE